MSEYIVTTQCILFFLVAKLVLMKTLSFFATAFPLLSGSSSIFNEDIDKVAMELVFGLGMWDRSIQLDACYKAFLE